MELLVPYSISAGALASSSVPELDQPEWAPGTVYVAGYLVQRTPMHRVYMRISTGGGTTAPEYDTTNWLDRGPTNRMAMWDGSLGTYTTGAGVVSSTVQIGGPAADVAILDATPGASVTVSGPGTGGSGTVGASGTLLMGGLALQAGNVTVTVSGGSVQVGSCLIGTFTDLGETIDQPKLSMADRSVREFDAYGRARRVRRHFQRVDEYAILFPTSRFDVVAGALTAVRSQASLWRGIPWLGVSVLYGMCVEPTLTLGSGDIETSMSTGALRIKSLAMGVAQ